MLRNICPATDETVTLSADDCDRYIRLVNKDHVGSRCTYNTPRSDSDTELSYRFCLYYHLMKSLGADSVCADKITLTYMCSLFGFMKESLQDGSLSTERTMIYDTDIIVQKEMFSNADGNFRKLVACEYHSMLFKTNPEQLDRFFNCITIHFINEMGARSSCFDNSLRSDSDANIENTTALFSKDHLFYNFMVDTLDAENICPATDDTVRLSPDDCDWYIRLVKVYHARSRCTHNTLRTDKGTELPYRFCLHYHFMKSLGADSVCTNRMKLAYMCNLFGFLKELLQEAGCFHKQYHDL